MCNLDDEKKTLSVEEAARYLGIGRNTAYECVRKGEIPSIRLGRRILVPRNRLEQLLNTEVSMKDDEEM